MAKLLIKANIYRDWTFELEVDEKASKQEIADFINAEIQKRIDNETYTAQFKTAYERNAENNTSFSLREILGGKTIDGIVFYTSTN